MTGPKTNEGATVAGERVGTRATAKFIRGSATKARQVLDLIRGLDVQRADDVLRFTEREMAATIRKVLASAVANAEHNDSQGRDELYVAACFADEGPTLRRFRPRARGRATRIRKRTCHITVIVARMSEEELERKRRHEEAARPTGRRGGRAGVAPAASRRARVAKSRQATAEATAPEAAVDEAVEVDAEEVEVDAEESRSTRSKSMRSKSTTTRLTDDTPDDDADSSRRSTDDSAGDDAADDDAADDDAADDDAADDDDDEKDA